MKSRDLSILVLPFALLATSPAWAQDAPSQWSASLSTSFPSLTGGVSGRQDGQPIQLSWDGTMGLKRSGLPLGASLDYQGPRFGLSLGLDQQTFQATHQLQDQVQLEGATYLVGTRLDSEVKFTSVTLDWTIRLLRQPDWWAGLDLGVKATTVTLSTTGTVSGNAFTTVEDTESAKFTLPLPLFGVAGGFQAMDGKLVGRGYYHFLKLGEFSYNHAGVALTYYPIPQVGGRLAYDSDVMKASSSGFDAQELKIARQGVSLGVVYKF
jgi:hypothetical protein